MNIKDSLTLTLSAAVVVFAARKFFARAKRAVSKSSPAKSAQTKTKPDFKSLKMDSNGVFWGLAFVVIDKELKRVVRVNLCEDFALPCPEMVEMGKNFPETAHIAAFLDSLSSKFPYEIKPGQVFHNLMEATDPKLMSRGYARRLVGIQSEIASRRGFIARVSEMMHPATVHMGRQEGAEVLNALHAASFVFDGKRPFGSLDFTAEHHLFWQGEQRLPLAKRPVAAEATKQ